MCLGIPFTLCCSFHVFKDCHQDNNGEARHLLQVVDFVESRRRTISLSQETGSLKAKDVLEPNSFSRKSVLEIRTQAQTRNTLNSKPENIDRTSSVQCRISKGNWLLTLLWPLSSSMNNEPKMSQEWQETLSSGFDDHRFCLSSRETSEPGNGSSFIVTQEVSVTVTEGKNASNQLNLFFSRVSLEASFTVSLKTVRHSFRPDLRRISSSFQSNLFFQLLFRLKSF